jgi:phenylpyruvate tautomerase PptA (4-oxalocrotonate tautomerase family)
MLQRFCRKTCVMAGLMHWEHSFCSSGEHAGPRQVHCRGQARRHRIVELKVPSFALATPEQKQGFIADATDAVERASQGRLPRERIWVNMTYAVDGLWGIKGEAYPNQRLLESVSAAAG